MIQVSDHMFAIYLSSPIVNIILGLSDTENTMTAMLMPQLMLRQKHSSTSDAGADTLELYSSSSTSDTEVFGHQKKLPKEKKM